MYTNGFVRFVMLHHCGKRAHGSVCESMGRIGPCRENTDVPVFRRRGSREETKHTRDYSQPRGQLKTGSRASSIRYVTFTDERQKRRASDSHGVEDGERGLAKIHFQFGHSLFGRRVSFTKQDSQTLVPSFSVKSTLRLNSISAPHFPHDSVWASFISTLVRLASA
jgi:hypothetical protein